VPLPAGIILEKKDYLEKFWSFHSYFSTNEYRGAKQYLKKKMDRVDCPSKVAVGQISE
jgi:hypothetical protein